MSKITCVLPVYNVEKYILGSLECLNKQTFRDFDVLCVDDGSTDRSAELVSEYAKTHDNVRLIPNAGTKGAGGARNYGISQADGEYVICLDADDIYRPQLLEKLYETIVKYDADIAQCYIAHFTDGEVGAHVSPDRVGRSRLYIDDYPVLDKPGDHAFIWELITNCPFDKLIRRSFIEKYQLRYGDYPHTNDMGFQYSAVMHADRMVFVDDILYLQRQGRRDSVTGHRSREKSYMPQVLEDIYRDCSQSDISKESREAYQAYMIRKLYGALREIGEYRELLLKEAGEIISQLAGHGFDSPVTRELIRRIGEEDFSISYGEILYAHQTDLDKKTKSSLCKKFIKKRGRFEDYIIDTAELDTRQVLLIFRRVIAAKLTDMKAGKFSTR